MTNDDVYEEDVAPPASTGDNEKPREAPRRGRRPPPRSKSVDDSGSLAQMRATRSKKSSTGPGSSGGDDSTPARTSRRGARRAPPGRTKSADDMAAMGRMTRYARQKSKEEEQKGDDGGETKE